MLDFIKVVENILEEQGKSKQVLFENNIVSENTFFKYRHRYPSLNTVMKIANFLNVSLDYDFLFKGLPNEITVGRYHSLSLKEYTLPDCLEIISKAKDDGEVMAVKHKDYNVYGLQFHPESILTPDGLTIMENFMEKVERGIL